MISQMRKEISEWMTYGVLEKKKQSPKGEG